MFKFLKKIFKKKFKIYLSGRITGNPIYREQFEIAENNLRAKGFDVLNPAKTKAALKGLPDSICMKESLKMLLQANVVVQIHNNKSEGMIIEELIAKRCKIAVLSWLLENKHNTIHKVFCIKCLPLYILHKRNK